MLTFKGHDTTSFWINLIFEVSIFFAEHTLLQFHITFNFPHIALRTRCIPRPCKFHVADFIDSIMSPKVALNGACAPVASSILNYNIFSLFRIT